MSLYSRIILCSTENPSETNNLHEPEAPFAFETLVNSNLETHISKGQRDINNPQKLGDMNVIHLELDKNHISEMFG